MSGEFLDTNILVYAFDRTAGAKRITAARLIERLWDTRQGCVSLQVLQEFYVVSTRKLGMNAGDAARHIERLGHWTLHRPALPDVLAATKLSQDRVISFWDALIIQSTLQLGCTLLWSEDLNPGQSIAGVTVRNPFTAAAMHDQPD